jgi:hypothetical protein
VKKHSLLELLKYVDDEFSQKPYRKKAQHQNQNQAQEPDHYKQQWGKQQAYACHGKNRDQENQAHKKLSHLSNPLLKLMIAR